MSNLKRTRDITALTGATFDIAVDGKKVKVAEGETLLSAMLATEKRRLMKNDHQCVSGAYCGMGVCHCCHVRVDGKHKQRACQTLAKDGMTVSTVQNRFDDFGIK